MKKNIECEFEMKMSIIYKARSFNFKSKNEKEWLEAFEKKYSDEINKYVIAVENAKHKDWRNDPYNIFTDLREGIKDNFMNLKG